MVSERLDPKTHFVPTHEAMWGALASPVGALLIVVSEAGVQRVDFLDDSKIVHCSDGMRSVVVQSTSKQFTGKHPLLCETVVQLVEYFEGNREKFSLPIDVAGTDFQRQAWLALADVPFGETATYKQQAERIGRPKAVRAVGVANSKNPVAIVLPCHRIIGSDGSLTGYAGGLDKKQWLLRHEHSG